MTPKAIKTFLSLLLVMVFALPVSGNAPAREQGTEKLPFDTSLRYKIRTTFYDGELLQISPKKIRRYEEGVLERYRQVRENMLRYLVHYEGLSKKKARKKARKESDVKAYEVLLEYISRLKKIKDHTRFHLLALRVLELDESLKVEGKKLASTMLFEKFFASLRKWKIPVKKAKYGEAANLVDETTGLFFSQLQLKRMKKAGVDISKLNPPKDSTFWQPLDIPSVDVAAHYHGGKDPLHKGMEIIFPNGAAFYKKVRRTQTKPKIDVYIRHPETGKKVNFKLKVGAEMHSDITASSLYAALGFPVDISKYVRDFKLVLGDVTPHDFKRQWNTYYSRYDVDRYIKKQGRGENGHYIVFHEGLLEAKPKGLVRAGPWAYGDNGHKGLRETRGTLIFNMWVSNLDLKESENNKLVLRKFDGEDDYRFFHLQHDMGYAFGTTYIERPGDFSWKLVKKRSKKYVHMNYRCFQRNSGFKHVTFADAKWMSRLIAQLTRKQLEDAVKLGGWPESMGQLLVEKLISRRNQLVMHFDLENETLPNGKKIKRLPFNPYLTTKDGVVVQGKLKIYEIKGYKQNFGPRIKELIPILLRGIKNGFIDGAVNGLSAIRSIKMIPGKHDDDRWPDIMSRTVIRMNREIELNPHPTGLDDDYLVKDSLEMGLRLGYGDVLSGDVMFVRRYHVVYPVRTRAQGRYHRGFIIDLLLSANARKLHKLNTPFVMISEDYLEGRGRIKVGANEHSLLGASLGASKIYLHRHFVSRKHPDYLVFFRDDSLSRQFAAKIYLGFTKLFRFRIPIYTALNEKGRMKRQQVTFDLTGLRDDPHKQEALDRLFMANDSSKILELGKVKIIDDRFQEKKNYFTLFGLIKDRAIFRVDRLQEKGNDKVRFQVDSQKSKAWRFIDNGEQHLSWVRLTGKTNGKTDMEHSLLRISLRIADKNTTDGELKNCYLKFINTAAQDKDFLGFDCTAHSCNKLWGNVLVFFKVDLYKEAIKKLINVTPDDVWRSLAVVTQKHYKRLKKISKPILRGGKLIYMGDRQTSRIARKTSFFIQELKRARKAKTLLGRMTHLVHAIRKGIFITKHGFDPTILAVLHRLVGSENLYMEAAVTMPLNKENIFPERVPLFNTLGERRPVEPEWFEYIFETPSEIYHLF